MTKPIQNPQQIPGCNGLSGCLSCKKSSGFDPPSNIQILFSSREKEVREKKGTRCDSFMNFHAESISKKEQKRNRTHDLQFMGQDG